MYHPSRGGVRGGRDQFSWEDVKVDKHRENYLGHSIRAPVGRWQKGKDLHWYNRDKKSSAADAEAAKEEIKRIKEEEEQAMREALGLAPKRATRPHGNRLDKHEYAELVKRGSTAEDLGAGHAEAAQVQGLGLYKVPREQAEEASSYQEELKEVQHETEKEALPMPSEPKGTEEYHDEDERRKKRRREERREEKERKREKHEKKHSRNSDEKRKHHKDKERRRHDSD
ncbi:putative multiple myeloma tumor-associated protein [Dioscorea sansibarensis]